MIPSGIWSSAKAKLKSDTAPSPSRLASAVTTMNVICVDPEADRPRRHQQERLARLRVLALDPGVVAEAHPGERPELDEQMAERARDDAEGQSLDAEARARG